MYLSSLITGITIFACLVIAHIIMVRLIVPRQHIKLLFILFLLLPQAVAVFLLLQNTDSFTTNELFTSWLLLLSLCCAYIQTFPAVQANAPSLQIVYFLGQTVNGMTEEEICSNFQSEELLEKRIDDLITEGFVYKYDGQLCLTAKGKIFAGSFSFFRKMYGLELGEG